jgi:hypothetical protein
MVLAKTYTLEVSEWENPRGLVFATRVKMILMRISPALFTG